MDLFILRHGDAGKNSSLVNDFKRELTVVGKKEIADISNALRILEIKFDSILTSPLLRSKQTAEILSKSMKYVGKIEVLDSLKPEGNKLELYTVLSKMKENSTVLIVGHEPYLSTMIGDVISQSGCRIDLKKSGLARLKVMSTIPKIRGELRWLVTPKHLKKMS